MAPPKRGWRGRDFHNDFGRVGSRRGMVPSEQRGRKPCRNFQQTGSCPYGDQCLYSHDSTGLRGQRSSGQPRERSEETPEQQQAKADYNAWRRLLKTPPRANDFETMRSLWTKAHTILEGDDRDWKLMLPRDLDDDEYFGRQHVLTLLSMVAHAGGYSTFVDIARPFLLVVTHSALLDCLSVDTAVGGLYNFISGSNGSRAIPFFQRLITASLEQRLEVRSLDSERSLEVLLIAASTALRELLRRERRAIFHDDLPDLVKSIDNVTEAAGIQPDTVAFQVLHNGNREILGMIAHAQGLLQPDQEPQLNGVSSTVVTSTYRREITLPGTRHDNDNTDITKISILPTMDEIRSDHPPFLPSTDQDQPHFLTGQVERHLDTLFRLLRHDVFGELSESLGGLLAALEDDETLLENPKLSLGNTRAFVHPKTQIRYVSFDQRKGLEAQLSFPQPSLLRKKTAHERQKWWEESKRMEEGILLCFLTVEDTNASLVFFTISEKVTDSNKDYCLSSDSRRATITAKLARRSQRDLEIMTSISSRNLSGLLVEFPGVLLGTFLPILENLQGMQQLSRLPFRKWVIPDREVLGPGKSKFLEIPRPLYARKSGFNFSLKSILKDSADDLSIPATTSPDDITAIDQLEERTRLDRGQCSALIAALTREFSLIQGPPGCGKSYLGVQLMRVLFSCQEKAQLGPILIV